MDKRNRKTQRRSRQKKQEGRGREEERSRKEKQEGRGLVEGALVAGILAASAVGMERKGSMMEKSVKELAKSLEAVSEATEDVVKGTVAVPERLLKSVAGRKGRGRKTRKAGRR